MAKSEIYYWVDEGSAFGGGENPVQYGDPMPEGIEKDERFESFKKAGLISTEKVAGKRVLSELESVKQENLELKNKNLELVKTGGSGSGITQAQLDTAKGESVQADLDQLELIKDALDEIKPALSKDDILAKVKELKELFDET